MSFALAASFQRIKDQKIQDMYKEYLRLYHPVREK
jgi:hypothetical protein